MFESIAVSVLSALHLLDAMSVIGIFIFLLLALFATALTTIARGRAEPFSRSAPMLLTTLGILGTFLGIAIGLLDFDVQAIEYSIPILLDGLKLAFVTSIFGILLGAILRLVLVTTGGNFLTHAQETDTASVEPPAALQQMAMTEQLIALQEAQAHTSRLQLEATQQLSARIGEFDEHLAQRLQLQHGQVLETMQNLARDVSEMGSRQLIAALEGAIQDFNSKLGEQFGENFRRLDHSVEKLLQWQVQYRDHMEQLGQQLDYAVGAVKHSQLTLEGLTHQAMQISRHVEDQESVMAALRRETTELESLLGGIAELREKAQEAFPAMDARLRTMLESIEGAVLSALNAQQRLAQMGGGSAEGHASNAREFAMRANA